MCVLCIILCRKGDDYSRFQAAKDLFDAFLNRTQAYGLHHLVGLITFKSHVTVNLALTEKMVSFTVSLELTRALWSIYPACCSINVRSESTRTPCMSPAVPVDDLYLHIVPGCAHERKHMVDSVDRRGQQNALFVTLMDLAKRFEA